mmetsp:Transcript_8313/g.14717  ORF Transcript_8313/g.14717 Transcript_8313/m.14717 type:complete len:176 (-) Transcript_8313:113-640(-)
MELAQAQVDEAIHALEAALNDPSACSRAVKECTACLKGAEMEIRASGVSGAKRDELRKWLSEKKAKVQELERQALLEQQQRAGVGGEAAAVSNAARSKNVTDRMAKQSASIAQSLATLNETEVTAGAIMSDLAVQRETIKNTNQKLQDVNADVGYSTQLLNNMKSWWKIGSIQKK